jgi:hypothetical protein
MSREASAPDLGGRKGAGARTALKLLYRDFPINSTYRYRYLIYGNYYIGISLRIVPTSIGTSDLQSHSQYLEVLNLVQLEPRCRSTAVYLLNLVEVYGGFR